MITAGRLNQVQSLDDVLVFLREELDWPTEDLDLDDAAFDYEPAELGIDPDKAPNLVTIQELRPLVADQVWGIFFLEFDGPRLQVTQLRLLLDRLVKKKRGQGDGSRRSWDLEDLLFVVTTDSGQSVELHLLAFVDEGGNLPRLRSLPWRPEHSPHQHLTRLENELLPHLTWPDDPSDSDSWRSEWRKAFVLEHGEAITTASRLATRMAGVARHLRDLIATALEAEGGEGPFSTLLGEVRAELVADADEAEFADMCAQTLVYGVLTARIMDPESFGASPLLSSVPLANPFLSAFFEEIHDHALALDLDDSGLEALVVDLRSSNIETVLDQFEESGGHRDPVIHFYEEFLKEYDRSKRMEAGAFYTPHEVVRFMVRAVDEILKTRFGLSDGVADAGTWAQVAESNDFDIPDGIDPESPFVSMIDPATGTGTFLVEWLRQAEVSFKENHPDEDWPTHLEKHVIPSMHAFELMLGAYAIAHLKLAREIHPHGISMDPNTVLLTDTLEHPTGAKQFEPLADPVATEGLRASDLKASNVFTICVGNPPYGRTAKTASLSTGSTSNVICDGVVGVGSGRPLLDAYLEPLKREGLSGKHARSLYNLYVYFWRWATWQVVERRQSPGVVAFITASSFLEGVSFGGLREHLRNTFDQLFILDLGGDSIGTDVDENVFDIRIPVSICIGVSTSPGSKESCEILHRRVFGSRDEKFFLLTNGSPDSTLFQATTGSGLDSFVPKSDKEPTEWSVLSDLMPWSGRGIQFSRAWPIGETQDVLQDRWGKLVSAHNDFKSDLLRESRDAKVSKDYPSFLRPSRLAPVASLRSNDSPDGIERVAFRSFDRQWCLADRRVIDMPRPPLWKTRGKDQIFFVTLVGDSPTRGPALVATPYVPDLNSFNNRGGLAFPGYRDKFALEPNLPGGLYEALTERLGFDVDTEQVLGYLYGILGTSAYTNYLTAHVIPIASPPAVPITSDSDLFRQVGSLGHDLIWWHTWGERFTSDKRSVLPNGSATELDAISDYPNDFSYLDGILSVGTGKFGPVSPEVWEFEVSGLKVVKSWLGYRMWDRKGRKSSPLDDIRPEAWTFSEELLLLLSIIEHTVEVTPHAAELLKQVIDGPLISSSDLPKPTEAERKAPKR